MIELFLNPYYKLTGNDIYYIRSQLNITQGDMASKIGTSTAATICKWENNGAGQIEARYVTQSMIKIFYASHYIKDDTEFRKVVEKLFESKVYGYG